MHGLKRAEAAGHTAPPLLDWLDLRSSGEQATDVGGPDERHSTTDCTGTTDKRMQIIKGADPLSGFASRGARRRLERQVVHLSPSVAVENRRISGSAFARN